MAITMRDVMNTKKKVMEPVLQIQLDSLMEDQIGKSIWIGQILKVDDALITVKNKFLILPAAPQMLM